LKRCNYHYIFEKKIKKKLENKKGGRSHSMNHFGVAMAKPFGDG
jgi:hypothetical protein